MTTFKSLDEIFVSLIVIITPAEQLSVSAAAEKYRYLNNAGAYVGPWKNATVPEMVEPMDTFTSRDHSGMIFVGPAQAGKTDSLILNALTYSVMCEPMDLMLVCPTMADGRDFSIRRVDRLHMHSEKVGAMLLPAADADNKFDKQYSNGMLFTIGWPTVSQLAGKPIPRVIFTDRDRMRDDIDGDGEPFDLGSKRTTTFGSYAMTVAESSPSRPVLDLKWIPRTLHEAPPCEGILKLYNRGDRRRWHWPCPECNTYFEGDFSMLEWDNDIDGSNVDKAETVRMVCPHCHHKIKPDDRDEMRQWGIWLKDGQGFDERGRVIGEGVRTNIASFWLKGVAAAFISWRKLVSNFLDANDEYERTGSEEALKKFYNNDLAEPYYPKSMTDDIRSPETLKSHAEDDLPERQVPEGVRFLVALCDVQKNQWVVQVFGILPGVKRFDTVLVDRFDVRKSKRLDADGDALWVKPNVYLEDWDELTEHVIEKEYPLSDGSGRKMAIRFVGCDSGGKAGVTTMAYAYFRNLREQNKHRRFILLKGDPSPNNPRTRITYPDSNRRDSKAGARGDIPVLMLNSNVLKDDLSGRLDCLEPGKGMYRTPSWLSDSFYSELCAEIRTPKGWENKSGERNEAFDLSYYCIGLCVSELIGVERIDWDKPPGWAAEWDKNSLVSQPDSERRFTNSIESDYDFAAFGKALA